MSLISFFTREKKNTAPLAKERLQIIVAERRSGASNASYIPQLKQDMLRVLSKYFPVDEDAVEVKLEQDEDDLAVLELNVKLPEDQ